MARFLDLPIELLPHIVTHVLKSSHLAEICLVNRSFYEFTISLLYSKIIVRHWYSNWKSRVICVFRTLATYPKLAIFVRDLEIGDFPKGLNAAESDALLANCTQGLRNAKHLRSLIWTRDGSLTSEIIEALQHCEELSDVSINGNHRARYDPRLLPGLTRLKSITVIMPSLPVITVFPQWMSAIRGNLRSLTLICKNSAWINNDTLRDLTPYVSGLERLNIIGCHKLTHDGIWALVSQNVGGISALGLEVVSPAFDMAIFCSLCKRAGGLASLNSFTLTHNPNLLSDAWVNRVDDLLSDSPLELFQLYATTTVSENPLAGVLVARIISVHGSRLRKFSVHRIRLKLHTIEDVCVYCPSLRQLFIMLDPADLTPLGNILSLGSSLTAVHINLSQQPQFFQLEPLALNILSQCSPTVAQFGMQSRVWQVVRRVDVDSEGNTVTRPTLTTYENPDIPEQFLVVRA